MHETRSTCGQSACAVLLSSPERPVVAMLIGIAMGTASLSSLPAMVRNAFVSKSSCSMDIGIAVWTSQSCLAFVIVDIPLLSDNLWRFGLQNRSILCKAVSYMRSTNPCWLSIRNAHSGTYGTFGLTTIVQQSLKNALIADLPEKVYIAPARNISAVRR